MKYELTKEQIEAINRALNAPGYCEATVKIENGTLVVLQTKKKKIG